MFWGFSCRSRMVVYRFAFVYGRLHEIIVVSESVDVLP